MTRPTVSIVMPVYNREKLVSRAIESLLAQTMTDFECLIVDDGSTDNSAEIIRQYAAQDERIRLLVLPANGGQGLARAIGTDAAVGEYLAVMDSDDVALPDRLAAQVKYMSAHPEITLAGANALKVSSGQKTQMQMPATDSEIKARLLMVDTAFVHPTVIMRLDFLREHNLNYSGQRRNDDDYAFYNRMLQAGATFANMPETVLQYHRHGGNITATNSLRSAQDKTPLRADLLRLFYPDMTGREINALARAMEGAGALNAKQVYAGLLAAEKAVSMMQSQLGEDHRVLNAILKRYLDPLLKALKSKGLAV